MNISTDTLQRLTKAMSKATTSGIDTSTGLNYYYLEPLAKNLYPVFYPLLASTPRSVPMFGGQRVGGTTVNWKAITGIGSGYYVGLDEGKRNSALPITTQNYAAPFRYFGVDIPVTFQAEMSGLGFEDNLGQAQLNLLNQLLNSEEQQILFGNSGPSSAGGANGYALGTCPTPTATLETGGSIATSTYVSAYCVALTPWGAVNVSTSGVMLAQNRTNQDGSSTTFNGGTSKVSAGSPIVETVTGSQSVKFTVTPVLGAVAYAWYVDSEATSTQSPANAFFAATTPYPTYTATSLPSSANQNAGVAGLQSDASYNTQDLDGMTTWAFNYAAGSQPSFVKDLGGAALTANGDGTIQEFEELLDFLWANYKITPDAIYCGGATIDDVTKAILSGPNAAQRIFFNMNEAGKLTGGTKVAEYRSKYSNTASAKSLPVSVHPWLPDGMIYFDLINNPYPAAGGAVPSVRRVITLEDHFAIRWPLTSLQYPLGVYTFEALQNYIPFGTGVLTGIKSGSIT